MTNIHTLNPTSINTKDCFPMLKDKAEELTDQTKITLVKSWLRDLIQELQFQFDSLGQYQKKFGWDLVLDGKLEELESFLHSVEALK